MKTFLLLLGLMNTYEIFHYISIKYNLKLENVLTKFDILHHLDTTYIDMINDNKYSILLLMRQHFITHIVIKAIDNPNKLKWIFYELVGYSKNTPLLIPYVYRKSTLDNKIFNMLLDYKYDLNTIAKVYYNIIVINEQPKKSIDILVEHIKDNNYSLNHNSKHNEMIEFMIHVTSTGSLSSSMNKNKIITENIYINSFSYILYELINIISKEGLYCVFVDLSTSYICIHGRDTFFDIYTKIFTTSSPLSPSKELDTYLKNNTKQLSNKIPYPSTAKHDILTILKKLLYKP